jgi:hypothetical protein
MMMKMMMVLLSSMIDNHVPNTICEVDALSLAFGKCDKVLELIRYQTSGVTGQS